MNIVVCVKQVPDTTVGHELTPEMCLKRVGVDAVLDPFDEFAIEEAIRQKEAVGGEVTILTMGAPTAQDTMRKALAMGADSGVLVTDDGLRGADTWGTARTLAAALKTLTFDLVLCGQESADARTGLLPGALAEILELPLLSYAEELKVEAGKATIQRSAVGGTRSVTAHLPVVVTVGKAINEPRYPSLKGIMAAKRKEIRILALSDLALDSVGFSRTRVVGISRRPERESGDELILPELKQPRQSLTSLRRTR